MADSQTFTVTCEELEAASSLDKLEARGTIRIALKSSGLDAGSVTPRQMQALLDKVLPDELETRGVEDAAAICSRIKAAFSGIDEASSPDGPEAVFSRLGS